MVWDDTLKAEESEPLANLKLHVAETPVPLPGANGPNQPALSPGPSGTICSPPSPTWPVSPQGLGDQLSKVPRTWASGSSPAPASFGLLMCIHGAPAVYRLGVGGLGSGLSKWETPRKGWASGQWLQEGIVTVQTPGP